MFGCVVIISELGKFAKQVEISTKRFKKGVKIKSKYLQINCEIGEIIASMELIKPPKEIIGRINALIIFAKTEYKLNVLK